MRKFLNILLLLIAFALNVSVVNAKNTTGQGGTCKEFMMAMMADGDPKSTATINGDSKTWEYGTFQLFSWDSGANITFVLANGNFSYLINGDSEPGNNYKSNSFVGNADKEIIVTVTEMGDINNIYGQYRFVFEKDANQNYVCNYYGEYTGGGGSEDPTPTKPAAPSISINHGFEVNADDGGGYTISNTLTFTESTSGANIYYTTDGTDPQSYGQTVSNNGQVVIGLDSNYSNVTKIRAVAELSGTYSDETTMDKAYTPELSTNGTTLSITQNDANTYIFYHGNGETTWTCMKSGRTINNYANIAPVSVVAATAGKLLSNIAVQNGGGTLPTSGDWDYGSWNTSSPGSLQINCSGKLLRYKVSSTRGQDEPTASSGTGIENSNTFYFPLSSLSSDGTYYLQILTGDYNSTPIGVYTWQVTKSGSSYTYEYLGKNEETPTAPAEPVISIESYHSDKGGYVNFQITDATGGATIEYSVDGGTTWEPYTKPFYKYASAINGNSYTIKARATKNGKTSETTQTFYKTATPTYTINGTTLTIISPSDCNEIVYKLGDGSWTRTSLSSNHVTISGLSSSSLLSFRVVQNNSTDLYSDVVTNLAAPTISIDKYNCSGDNGAYVYFKITDATENATIKYNTNGSSSYNTYNDSSKPYLFASQQSNTTDYTYTIYSMAELNGHQSVTTQKPFTKTDDPIVNLSGKTLSIEGDYNGFVYKVGDGSWTGELNQKSATLSSAPAAGKEIKVRAYKTGNLFSNEVTYTVLTEPTISISHGMEREYCTPATDDFDGNTINSLNNYITLTAEGNPTIYYTIDGSNPITNPNNSRQTYSNKFVCADINNNYSEVSAITVRAVSYANEQYSDIVSTTFTKATSPTISLSGTTLTINGGVWMAYKPNSTSSWIRRLSNTKEITEYDSNNTVSAIAAIQNQLLSNPAIYPTPEGTDWAYGTWNHYNNNEENLQVLSGSVPDFYYTISGTRYENEPTTFSTHCTGNQATVLLSNLSDGTHYVQILAYNQGPLGVYTWKVTKDGNSYTYEYLGKNETAQTLPAPEFSTNFQGRSGAGEVDPYVFFGISNYDDIIATSGNYIKYSFDGETWKTEIQTKSSAPEIGCILAYADDFERKGDKITIYAKTVNGNNESAVVSKEYTKTDAPTVAHNNGKITITAPQTDWDEIMFSTDGGDNWFIHKSSDDNTFVVYPTTQDAPSYDGESPLYVLARAFKSGGDYIYSDQDCFIGPAPIKQLKYHYSEMENWFEVNSVVGLKIRYTLDGTDPKESETAIEFRMDSVYMDKLLCSSLEVDSKTVKTVATDGYGHFSDVVEKTFTKSDMPIFTDYGASIELKVNDSYETIHNVIYYKQNSGDWDNTTWTPLIYKKNFNTVQAVAVLNNWQKLMSDMLIIEKITPPTLTYNQNANQVTISCEEGKTLKYSTNGGTTWQTASGQSKTLVVPQGGSLSVQAYCTETKVDYPVANKTTIYTSDVSTDNYTYTTPSKTQPDAPTITYTEGSGKVTISTDEEGTTGNPVYLIYTTNGTEPVLDQDYTVEDGVPTASDANTVVVTGNSTSFYITSTKTVNAKVYCGKYTTPASDNATGTFTVPTNTIVPIISMRNDSFTMNNGVPDFYNRFGFNLPNGYNLADYVIHFEFTQDGKTLYNYNEDESRYLEVAGQYTKIMNDYGLYPAFNATESYTSADGSETALPFDNNHPLRVDAWVTPANNYDDIKGYAYATFTQSTKVQQQIDEATHTVSFDADGNTDNLKYYINSYDSDQGDYVWTGGSNGPLSDLYLSFKYTVATSPREVYTVSSQPGYLKVVTTPTEISMYARPDAPKITYVMGENNENATVTISTDEESENVFIFYTTDGSEPVIEIDESNPDNPVAGNNTTMVVDKTINIKNITESTTIKAKVYCYNTKKFTDFTSDMSTEAIIIGWTEWEPFGLGSWNDGRLYANDADMEKSITRRDVYIRAAKDPNRNILRQVKVKECLLMPLAHPKSYAQDDDSLDYYNAPTVMNDYKDNIFSRDLIINWYYDNSCEINSLYSGQYLTTDGRNYILYLTKDDADANICTKYKYVNSKLGSDAPNRYNPITDVFELSFYYCEDKDYIPGEIIADSCYATLKMEGMWLGNLVEDEENNTAEQEVYMPKNSMYRVAIMPVEKKNYTFDEVKEFINSNPNTDIVKERIVRLGDETPKESTDDYIKYPAYEGEKHEYDAYKMLDKLPIEEEGAYYIASARLAPSIDSNGTKCYDYTGAYRYMPVYFSPSSKWTTLSYDGMRTYSEDLVCIPPFKEVANSSMGMSPIDYNVKVEECIENPGLFRVKDMYHSDYYEETYYCYTHQGECEGREGVYFYIDTRGDEKTDGDGNKYREAKLYPENTFYAYPLGVDYEVLASIYGKGEIMLTDLAGGKYQDGKITFEGVGHLYSFEDNAENGYEYDGEHNSALVEVNTGYGSPKSYYEEDRGPAPRFTLQISTPYPLFDDTPYTTTDMNTKWKDEYEGNSEDYNEKYGEVWAMFDEESDYYEDYHEDWYTDGITYGQDHVDVTYERNITNYYGTIMMPFDFNSQDLVLMAPSEDEEDVLVPQDGIFELYEFDRQEGQKLVFTKAEDAKANTPIVFKFNGNIPKNAKLTIDIKDTEVKAVSDNTDYETLGVVLENDGADNWQTIGAYTPLGVEISGTKGPVNANGIDWYVTNYGLDNSYAFTGNEIKKSTQFVRTKQYRAFFYNNSTNTQSLAKSYAVFYDDAPFTSITDPTSGNEQRRGAEGRYNVAGQKVKSGYRGIVIENGKKRFVK